MKYLRQFTMLVLGFIGITAVIFGGLLMYDTSGSAAGRYSGNLTGSPYDTFFVPGLLLFILLGLGAFAVLLATYRHFHNYPVFIIYFAVLVTAFVLLQAYLLDTFNSLDGAYLLLGAFLILLAWLMNNQLKNHHKKMQETASHPAPRKSIHHKHRSKKK